MTIQVLISTVDQRGFDLLDRMNLQSDAVVVNQCDKDEVIDFNYRGYKIKWISMKKRGVGLSRNTALCYADADIVLWADDDMIYVDGYPEMIFNAFESNRRIDVLCFNLDIYNASGKVTGLYSKIKQKIGFHNCMRYGAPTIVARRKVIIKNNIFFSLLFGGGAEFSSGEDSLFILNCVKKGLYTVACPQKLADVHNETSTWFTGFTDKFFIDKGRFYYLAFPKVYFLVYIFYSIKFPRVYKTRDFISTFKLFLLGRDKMRAYR